MDSDDKILQKILAGCFVICVLLIAIILLSDQKSVNGYYLEGEIIEVLYTAGNRQMIRSLIVKIDDQDKEISVSLPKGVIPEKNRHIKVECILYESGETCGFIKYLNN